MKAHFILESLKQQKERMTVVRVAIIEELANISKPMSVADLQKNLKKNGTEANKTTFHREIDFLLKRGFIRKVQLGDRSGRYELVDEENHHHHLVCVECDSVEDVLLEDDWSEESKMINKTKRFKVLNHSLEFFGLCANCQ